MKKSPHWKILSLPGKWQIRIRFINGNNKRIGFMTTLEPKWLENVDILTKMDAMDNPFSVRVSVFWSNKPEYMIAPIEFQLRKESPYVKEWPKRKRLTRPNRT